MVSVIGHREQLLSGLQKALAEKSNIDLTITIGRSTFPCHKVILASRCPAIASILSSSGNTDHVTLDTVDARTFAGILNYVYAGKLPVLQPDDMNVLLTAADNLQMPDLKSEFDKIIAKETINLKNCLSKLRYADKFGLTISISSIIKFITRYFRKSWRNKILDKFNFDQMKQAVSDTDLRILNEQQLLEIVVDWLSTRHVTREEINSILGSVRLMLIKEEQLDEIMSTEAVAANVPLCAALNELWLLNLTKPPPFRTRDPHQLSSAYSPREYNYYLHKRILFKKGLIN